MSTHSESKPRTRMEVSTVNAPLKIIAVEICGGTSMFRQSEFPVLSPPYAITCIDYISGLFRFAEL